MNKQTSFYLLVFFLLAQCIILNAQSSYDALGGYFRLRNSGSSLTYGGFSQKGHFEGTSSTDPALWAETNYGLYFYTNGNAAAPRMSITAGGNIGIGLTNPSATFHIYTPSSSAMRFSRASSNDYGFEYGGSTFGLYDYTNNKYRWQANGNNLLLNQTDGFVGIGTEQPTTLLDLTKTSTNGVTLTIRNTGASSSSVSGLRMGNDVGVNRFEVYTLSSAYEQYGPYFPDGTSLANEGTGGLSLGALHVNGDLRMYTGGNSNAHERLRIQSNGNIISKSKILIGTTNADIGGSVNGVRFDTSGSIYNAISGTDQFNLPLYVDRRGENNDGISMMLARGGYYKASIGVVGGNNAGNNGGINFSTIHGNSTITEQMRITASGSIGIGTSNPLSRLSVYDDFTNTDVVNDIGIYGLNLGSSVTATSGKIIPLSFTAIGGTNRARAAIAGIVGADWGKMSLGFYTKNASNGTALDISSERMRITEDGNVGVGTTTPSEKLSVNGNVRAKKVIVSQSGWPDYIFDPGYQLQPLSALAAFIQKHQHLPDMPSAKEVEEKGISVGDNQALLLKKIEELTLYIIRLDESNKKLVSEIALLKQKKQTNEK